MLAMPHLTARQYLPVDVAPPLIARLSHMSIKGSVTITLDGSNKSAKLPLLSGSLGPDGFDIRKLYGELVLQLSFFVLKMDRIRVLASGIFWQRPGACAARGTRRKWA